MPIKKNEAASRGLAQMPNAENTLSINLPHWDKLKMHPTKNGSLHVERTPDGGVEIGCRENIHAWGTTETIRLDKDAYEVLKDFINGGEGGSYDTPYRETMIGEQVREQMGRQG